MFVALRPGPVEVLDEAAERVARVELLAHELREIFSCFSP